MDAETPIGHWKGKARKSVFKRGVGTIQELDPLETFLRDESPTCKIDPTRQCTGCMDCRPLDDEETNEEDDD